MRVRCSLRPGGGPAVWAGWVPGIIKRFCLIGRSNLGGSAGFVSSSHTGKTGVSSYLHQRGEHKASSPPRRQTARETSAVSSSLFLFRPSAVSSAATSASSAALSHRAVGVSFVLPPIFIVLANHCPCRAVPTMHQEWPEGSDGTGESEGMSRPLQHL